MTTRKVSPAPIDTVLAFELRILVLELSTMGQQCLYAPRVMGVDSPRLLQAGYTAVISEWWMFISRIVFWLATPSYYSRHGYQSFACFFTSACSVASLLE
jgi:hypothetical protein